MGKHTPGLPWTTTHDENGDPKDLVEVAHEAIEYMRGLDWSGREGDFPIEQRRAVVKLLANLAALCEALSQDISDMSRVGALRKIAPSSVRKIRMKLLRPADDEG